MAEQVVERWNKPMMAMHWIHMVTCLILIVTGFRIYLGWGFPSTYSQARALHMVAVVGFLTANLILLPYGMILEALEAIKHYGTKQGIQHFMKVNLFGMEDARRLKAILLNFFGKQKGYPALTIYDEKAGLYANRSHPLTKILIPLEAIFILLVTLSGIVLYNINWTILGLNVGAYLTSIATVAFWRTLHLGSMYYFVFDLFIHVGILQADPKLKHAWKAMFLTGKEDIKTSGYTKIVKK